MRAGDALGRYELGDELGEGGMATVFRARDRELRRDVALKVLFPHLARRPDVVHRFHREARAAAGLEHPNILRIYDVGGAEGDDPPYIVMELVRGRTLLQEIEQRGAMLAEVAACIGALLAEALAAAHAAGVIHRDVKPANVLIASGGRLLLADFGVARLETEDSLVTRTGALLGTPAYMSPEQANGDIATARSDLYSLGATLYQLATGALPYAGSPAKVMALIAAGNLVAPARRKPSCGPDLSRLIERMMAGDPGARPASATAIAGELRALATAGGLGDASEELAAYFEDPPGFLGRRTPTVVSALVTAARAAVAEDKLPRAMALADRASALAPDDRAVTALVQSVTEGGQASRRNRGLAIGALAVVLAGGAVAMWQFASGSAAEPYGGPAVDASVGFAPSDAAVATDRSGIAVVPSDSGTAVDRSGIAVAASDAGTTLDRSQVVVVPSDAAVAIDRSQVAVAPSDARRGSGTQTARPPGAAARESKDARAPAISGAAPRATSADPEQRGRGEPAAVQPGVAAPPIALTAPVDAAPPGEPHAPPDAPERGFVVVRNDVWCRISIDGVDHGNRRNERLEVAAGHRVVRCVNPVGEWTQEVDVAPGATRTLTGSVLRELEVTLEVDATIDGKPYARGSRIKLKPGNFEVIVGGRKQFITLRASCTLRDAPELGCYL